MFMCMSLLFERYERQQNKPLIVVHFCNGAKVYIIKAYLGFLEERLTYVATQ